MKLFTIGFTKSSAESFFMRLRDARVAKVIDVRRNNVSQLAGFAKRDDLRFFLESLLGVAYHHEPALAPTQALLDAYRADGDWNSYAARFTELLEQRVGSFRRDDFDRACLLCSEHEPTHCHRRLVAERLQRAWPDVELVHL